MSGKDNLVYEIFSVPLNHEGLRCIFYIYPPDNTMPVGRQQRIWKQYIYLQMASETVQFSGVGHFTFSLKNPRYVRCLSADTSFSLFPRQGTGERFIYFLLFSLPLSWRDGRRPHLNLFTVVLYKPRRQDGFK